MSEEEGGGEDNEVPGKIKGKHPKLVYPRQYSQSNTKHAFLDIDSKFIVRDTASPTTNTVQKPET